MVSNRKWFELWKPRSLAVSEGLPEPDAKQKPIAIPTYNGPAPKEYLSQIKFAFTSTSPKTGESRHYFYLTSDLNIPVMRANQSLEIWQELEFGITPVSIRAHCMAVKDLCVSEKAKKLSLEERFAKIYLLAERMNERIDLTTSVSVAMSLATIRYFDEKEDITGYDWAYNAEKKRFWTENHDVADFFLLLPIQAFTTSGKGLEENLTAFLKGEVALIKSSLLTQLSSIESTEQNSDTINSLNMQIADLEILSDWSKKGFTNTTFT